MRKLWWVAVLGLALLLGGAGCGDGERTFEAGEFVEAMNENGAALELGEGLTDDQEGIDVYDVSLAQVGAPQGAGGEHSERGASLILAANTETAIDEYDRCESAVSLVCFRAANAVLILDDDDPATLATIEGAIRDLEAD